MRFLLKVTCLIAGCLQIAYAQGPAYTAIPLNNLNSFTDAGKNWTIAADALADLTKPGQMKAISGEGVLVNIPGKANNSHLVTKESLGDVELELEFMMAKNSNSGVYLQGRYEVQLLDSWNKPKVTYEDCGGIYQRWDEQRPDANKGYEGIAPLANVARAPGLWQTLKVRFRAPRFDAQGKKIEPARFEEVYLNGTLVQQSVAVTGPTRSSLFEDEKATGPLMLQGDHGAVAFRYIKYRALGSADKQAQASGDNPILVKADNKPYVLRSFMNFGKKKLTHVVSVGNPELLNYAYNLQEGSLFQIWRGPFLDVTEMWHERGEPQLAKPLTSPIALSNAPAVAVLSDDKAAWPDSIIFENLKIDGYVLDKQRAPTFNYVWKDVKVADKITVKNQGEGLQREIKVADAPSNLYIRVASGNKIIQLSDSLYSIDDKTYYISLDKNLKAQLRKTNQGEEIIVRYNDKVPFAYDIIW